MSEIIVALITGGMTLIGVIITNARSARDIDAKLDKSQAVTESKLEELTREVREHNNFAKRIPLVEEQVKRIPAIEEQTQRIPVIEEKIQVANHRIDDLEAYHRPN